MGPLSQAGSPNSGEAQDPTVTTELWPFLTAGKERMGMEALSDAREGEDRYESLVSYQERRGWVWKKAMEDGGMGSEHLCWVVSHPERPQSCRHNPNLLPQPCPSSSPAA